MTTATASAEVDVPRELLPEFVAAATMKVTVAAEALTSMCGGDGLSLEFSNENRRQDDEKIVMLLAALAARETILRALDDGQLVPVSILADCADSAIGDLRDELGWLTSRRAGVDAGGPRASRTGGEHAVVAAKACLLRDLTAWCAENGLTTPQAATA